MDPKRLKRILDITKRVEKARQGELANARTEFERSLTRIESAKRDERACFEALEDSGELSVMDLSLRVQALSDASAQLRGARERHVEHDAELQRRQGETFEATRDVRKFEVLRQRDDQRRKLEERNAEQQTLDETRRLPPRKGG